MISPISNAAFPPPTRSVPTYCIEIYVHMYIHIYLYMFLVYCIYIVCIFWIVIRFVEWMHTFLFMFVFVLVCHMLSVSKEGCDLAFANQTSPHP